MRRYLCVKWITRAASLSRWAARRGGRLRCVRMRAKKRIRGGPNKRYDVFKRALERQSVEAIVTKAGERSASVPDVRGQVLEGTLQPSRLASLSYAVSLSHKLRVVRMATVQLELALTRAAAERRVEMLGMTTSVEEERVELFSADRTFIQ